MTKYLKVIMWDFGVRNFLRLRVEITGKTGSPGHICSNAIDFLAHRNDRKPLLSFSLQFQNGFTFVLLFISGECTKYKIKQNDRIIIYQPLRPMRCKSKVRVEKNIPDRTEQSLS